MSGYAKDSIRRAVLTPDRPLQLVQGGSGPPAGATSSGSDDECPVTALGHLDGACFFLDARGQQRRLSARQLGMRQDLLFLFGGDDEWLREHFPKRVDTGEIDANGKSIWKTIDFKLNDVAAALQRACFAAGLYGDHIVLRRPGIWRGDDGRPAVHCGDAVLLGGVWQPAGTRSAGQVWGAAPAVPRPDEPCSAAVAKQIVEGLVRLWCWREPGSPIAVLGLIANAYYGAALDWRPAGFVTGETGGGKSSLQKVMRACLPLHHYDNDTSKAGIEQAVQGRAMPIIIDEASDRANRSSARDLVDLVLSATGGEGTKGSRGTSDGVGRRIELAGLIVMFSINTPELEPQHLGRFTIIDLRAPQDGEDNRAEHDALAQFARSHAAQLWGRALTGWDRYQAALIAFREGLGRAGCAPRERDQAGALLAGWWVLTHEGVPGEAHVREGIAALAGHVRDTAAVAEDSRPRRMVQHLLFSQVALHRSSEREPIGKLLGIAFSDPSEDSYARQPSDAQHLLAGYGMRVVLPCARQSHQVADDSCGCRHCTDETTGKAIPRLGRGGGVWVATTSPELRRVFADTPFEGDRWRAELLRLDGARASARTIRIGGIPCKPIWVPRDELLGRSDADQDRPP